MLKKESIRGERQHPIQGSGSEVSQPHSPEGPSSIAEKKKNRAIGKTQTGSCALPSEGSEKSSVGAFRG